MTYRGNQGIIATTDATLTAGAVITSGSFSAIDVKSDVQKDVVRNGVNDTIAKTYSDLTERKGTFEFTTLINPFTPMTASTLVTIASTVNATWNGVWIVEDYAVKNSSGKAQTCTYDLSYNGNVQS